MMDDCDCGFGQWSGDCASDVLEVGVNALFVGLVGSVS